MRETVTRKGKSKLLIQCSCGKYRRVDKWDYLNLPHKNLGVRCQDCSRRKYWKNKDELRLYHLIFKDYAQQAKRRGYEYTLTLEESYELFISNCHFCGESPSNTKTHGKNKTISFNYQGIDRKDPSKGYVSGNCLPCCKHCNYAKREMTYEEFLKWVEKVYVVQRLFRKEVGSSEPK